MRLSAVSGTAIWVMLGPIGGMAQAEVIQPANLPPSNYTSDRFVDRNGCQFLRADPGSGPVWVPMVDDSRQPICGMAPVAAQAAVPTLQASGAVFIQIGSFGQVGNARKAAARLDALGLAAETHDEMIAGRLWHVVLSGPYADASQASTALHVLQGAGFPDSILLQ